MKGADEKIKLLRNIPFLKDLADSEIDKLADVMTPFKFTKDQVLFRKGDMGNNFYIVDEGTLVAKNIAVGQSTYEDMELGPGAYAGERAIITGESRAADLVAKTDGMAFVINKDTFASVLGNLEGAVLRSNYVRQLVSVFSCHPSRSNFREC
jgi:CRP-like cAMP-binding protein